MTKNTKLVWRLGKLPTVQEIQDLVKDKIISQEEAREVLFSSETEELKDLKSLEAEVKFLKEIIESLSRGVKITEAVKQTPLYYEKYPWYDGIRYLSTYYNMSTLGENNNLIS